MCFHIRASCVISTFCDTVRWSLYFILCVTDAFHKADAVHANAEWRNNIRVELLRPTGCSVR
jgi:hypothetical protein